MEHIFIYFKAYVKNNSLNLIWILLFSVFIFVIVSNLMRKQKKKHISNTILSNVCGLLLSLDCSFIFVMTLFKREVIEDNTFDFDLFTASVKALRKDNPELLLQVIMNIVMFIPIGVLLPCCFGIFEKHRYVLLITFISSLCIEIIQGVFKIGYFEIVDIINNIAGASIGVLIHVLFVGVQNMYNKKSSCSSEGERK